MARELNVAFQSTDNRDSHLSLVVIDSIVFWVLLWWTPVQSVQLKEHVFEAPVVIV